MYLCKHCKNSNSFYSLAGLTIHTDIRHHYRQIYVKLGKQHGMGYEFGTFEQLPVKKIEVKRKKKILKKDTLLLTREILKEIKRQQKNK